MPKAVPRTDCLANYCLRARGPLGIPSVCRELSRRYSTAGRFGWPGHRLNRLMLILFPVRTSVFVECRCRLPRFCERVLGRYCRARFRSILLHDLFPLAAQISIGSAHISRRHIHPQFCYSWRVIGTREIVWSVTFVTNSTITLVDLRRSAKVLGSFEVSCPVVVVPEYRNLKNNWKASGFSTTASLRRRSRGVLSILKLKAMFE